MTELDDLLNTVAATDNTDESEYKTVDEVFQEFVAMAEIAEGRFVADFLDRMFAAAYFQRSNCKKVKLYNVFHSAVEAVALFDDDHSPAERLATFVARAGTHLFDAPNPACFRDAIIRAFEISKFRDFSGLAEAIRREEASESIRRVALSLRTKPRTKTRQQIPDWSRITVRQTIKKR